MNRYALTPQPSSSKSQGKLQIQIRRLGRLLLNDLPLGDWEFLWIAPHGELYQLPWAALEIGDGSALVDRCIPSVATNAAAVATLLHNQPTRPRQICMAGAANPGLPFVDCELAALQGLYPTCSIKRNVTRRGFLELLESCDAVHLAGHGAFLDVYPDASGLRFDDGFLTPHDLAAARLSSRFVSFGVCSGLRVAGATGGMQGGFLRALTAGGIRTAVGPFLPARDDLVYLFDVSLFAALRHGDGPGHAYRKAVQCLRRDNPHPAAWGAFHLYGDPRPWEDP